MDAAIGTLLCLGIHNAHSCGIGGGFFMTIYARSVKLQHNYSVKPIKTIIFK